MYEVFKDRLPSLIHTAHAFNCTLEYLTIEQRTEMYEAVKDRLPSLVANNADFYRVLQYLLPEQCSVLCNALSVRFPRLMEFNVDNIVSHIELLSPEQCATIFNALKDRIQLVIHDSVQLSSALKRIPIEKSLSICDALKNILPSLSQRSPHFNFIGEVLDSLQNEPEKNAFCSCIRSYLMILMKKAGGLKPFLMVHATHQGSILFGLKQQFMDELNAYIDSISLYKDASSRPDFRHGFWAFKQSKALNREINYTLAIKLKSELSAEEADIQAIFEHTEAFRQEIIRSNHFDENPDFVDRGIQSTRLNRIINKM